MESENQNRQSIKPFIVIATSIILLSIIAYYVWNSLQFKVLSTTPSHNTENVALQDSVTITFNKDIASNEDNVYTITQSPYSLSNVEWSTNSVTVSPSYIWNPGTTYTITLSKELEVLYTLNFSTINSAALSPEEVDYIVATTEKDYSDSEKRYFEENPWVANLPLITDIYAVRWAGTSEILVIKIKDRDQFTEDQVEADLKAIGVPFNELTVQYD